MLGAQLPLMNKQLAGYPVEPVCYRGEGWGLEKFAAALGAWWPGALACDGCGGSIGGDRSAAPGARIGWLAAIRAPLSFQALSAAPAGQVAAFKSQRLVKALELQGFRCLLRLMASYAPKHRDRADSAQLLRGGDRARGGCFPLSVRVPSPYPGRAGQTQDLQKPAQGPACRTGCTSTTAEKARKTSNRRMGSGARVSIGQKLVSAGAKAAAMVRGPGNGLVFAAHFQLNRGKIAKLGGGRG